MSDLRTFNLQVEAFARSLPREHFVPFHRKIALQVLSGVVLKTPVDTGRARGNWQTTINQAPDSELLSANPIGDGVAALADLPPFVAIYISNNVPYINRLEDGYSRQAPAGMVAVTLQEVRTQFGDS